MTAEDHGPLNETARYELAAIDSVLRGETAPAAHGELGELALLLREDRPRPAAHFVARLDERVERGEPRLVNRPPQPRGRGRDGRARRPLLVRGSAVGVLAALIVILAIPATIALLAGGARERGQSSSASRAARTPGLAARPNASETAQAASEQRSGQAKAAAATGNGVVTAPPPKAATAGPSGVSSPPARAVQQTTTLELGVPSHRLETVAQQIFSVTSAFNGYVLQSSATSGSQQQGSASFQLRVPSASVSGAIAAISHLGRVLSETNTTNDVTEQLASLQRSLGDARAERAQLLRQLASTAGSQEAAALRARLRGVEAHISGLASSLHTLTGSVDFTTIALTLSGERSAGLGAPGNDLTPGGAVHEAGQILSAALAVLLLAFAAMLPVAIAALLGWAALVSLRRRQREQALDAS